MCVKNKITKTNSKRKSKQYERKTWGSNDQKVQQKIRMSLSYKRRMIKSIIQLYFYVFLP